MADGTASIEVTHRGESCAMPDDALLGPFEGGYDNDDETVRWFDGYVCRCHGEIVKKSIHLTLKKPATFADTAVGGLG